MAAIEELRVLLFEGIDIARDGMVQAENPLAMFAVAQHVSRCEALRAIIEDMEAQTDEEWEAAHPEPMRH